METKKTLYTQAKDDEQNYVQCIAARNFLSHMAEKHKVESNNLLIGMQYGDLVIQSYDQGDSPAWKTLEVIEF